MLEGDGVCLVLLPIVHRCVSPWRYYVATLNNSDQGHTPISGFTMGDTCTCSLKRSH